MKWCKMCSFTKCCQRELEDEEEVYARLFNKMDDHVCSNGCATSSRFMDADLLLFIYYMVVYLGAIGVKSAQGRI